MKQLDYNLLFRWFRRAVAGCRGVGTKNRDRLIAGDIASKFMTVLNRKRVNGERDFHSEKRSNESPRLDH
jgi:hypothetical protein